MTQTTAEFNESKAWLICLSAGLFFFYVFFQMNIFDVINQPLRKAFHLNVEQISWMSSFFVWSSILFFLPAGFMVDRYSTKKIIMTTISLCIIGTIGFSLTHSYLLACLFRSFVGISNAFCFTSCMVLIYRYFPPNKQALVIGSIITLAFLGGMIAHTPFAYLCQQIGWRKAMYIDAGVGIMILFWIILILKDKPTTGSKSEKLSITEFFKLVFNKQNLFAGTYTACLNLLIMVLCALWGTDYLKKVYFLTGLQASMVVSMILIGSICGSPIFGMLSDKLGRRKPIMILGVLLTLIMMAPLLLNIYLPLYALLCLFFCIGLFSSTQTLGYALISESNFSQHTGLAIAIASIIITGCGGVGQILFGKLLQYHAGQATTYFSAADFQYAFILLPISLLIAAGIICGIKETYCSRIQ